MAQTSNADKLLIGGGSTAALIGSLFVIGSPAGSALNLVSAFLTGLMAAAAAFQYVSYSVRQMNEASKTEDKGFLAMLGMGFFALNMALIAVSLSAIEVAFGFNIDFIPNLLDGPA